MSTQHNNIIETENLTKRFGRVPAVNRLSLAVPRGSIYAFLGPNGAGKTTTIKMLMNIIRPSSGKITTLGADSLRLGPEELRQIGYVSENQQLPDWMTVQELMDYCRPMYPAWDDVFFLKLWKQFDLPLNQKIKSFSRGMKVKTALLASLSYRPKLLVLDEPFSGLDPLVRDEFIKGVLELTASEEWTIFVSSHDIDEVERLADWVGIIDKGTLKLAEKIETLQQRLRKIEVVLDSPITSLPSMPPQWLLPEFQGRTFVFTDSAFEEAKTEQQIKQLFPNCSTIQKQALSLRDMFITLAKSFNISSK